MKIAIVYDKGELNDPDVSRINRLLSKLSIESVVTQYNPGHLREEIGNLNPDIVALVGGDKLILKSLLEIGNTEACFLCLSGRRTRGFFSTLSVDELPDALGSLIRRSFVIEERIRIEAKVGDKSYPPALNEVALFSKLSGSLTRYSLILGDELIWRDVADGVIVATPTGSTAYALSAGGPILKDVDAFVIVPVNSLMHTHKPIVTSTNKTIALAELEPNENVLIVDGQLRINVDHSEVQLRKSKYSAKFIRITPVEIGGLDKKLNKRIPTKKTYEALAELPPSAKLVYKVLEYEGPLTTKEVVSKTGLPARTANYALKLLLDKGLVFKKSLDRDARINVYAVA